MPSKNEDISDFFTGERGAAVKEDHDEDLALNPVVQAKLLIEAGDRVGEKKFKAGRAGALKRLRLDFLGRREDPGAARVRALNNVDQQLRKEATRERGKKYEAALISSTAA